MTGKECVVVLGGSGAMGRIIVQDLLRTAKGLDVVCADLAPPARRGGRFVLADVTDPRSLDRALEGATVTIASLPYRFNLAAMKGALAAGSHYVDLGGLYHMTLQQLRLDAAFRGRGLTALLGVGSSPGITNVLAVHAALGLERVHEVHCEVASIDRTRFRQAPPLGFGYSVDTLLDEFSMPSVVFRRGKHVLVPPLDPRERVLARFPSPLGKVRLDTTLHSELATLPAHFRERGVREVTFRQGFDEGFAERLSFLARLGLADTTPLARLGLADTTPQDGGTTPRAVFLQLLRRLPAAVPIGKPWRYEVLRARVIGTRAGKRVQVTADCHAGPRAGRGIGPDIDTGAPPSIAAQLLLASTPPPGVFAPEDALPVEPFLWELERRGMKVTRRSRADPGS